MTGMVPGRGAMRLQHGDAFESWTVRETQRGAANFDVETLIP